jgi:hypothetical protein
MEGMIQSIHIAPALVSLSFGDESGEIVSMNVTELHKDATKFGSSSNTFKHATTVTSLRIGDETP